MVWRIRSVQGQTLADRSRLLWRAAAPLLLFLFGGGVVAVAYAQGLSAEADALAPNLLTVPGEAMLLDPPVQDLPYSSRPLSVQHRSIFQRMKWDWRPGTARVFTSAGPPAESCLT